MFNNISIKLKLIVSSILPVVGLVVVLVAGLMELREAKQGVNRIYDDRIIPLEDLKVIADNYAVSVIDAINKANAGLISVENSLESIQVAALQTQVKWKKYIATELTAEEQVLVGEAEVFFNTANLAIEEVTQQLKKLTGNVKGELAEFDGPLYAQIDPISDKINQLMQLQLSEAKKERVLIDLAYDNTLISQGIIAALVILFMFLMSIFLYRTLMFPLKEMQNTIETIASESNLTLSLSVNSKNELGQIAISFNKMIQQMYGIITHISTASDKIATASNDMTELSNQANASIESQHHEIEQVAAAMHQMVSTAQQIASNAELADKDARDTKEYANQGSLIVNQAVSATNALVLDVQSVSQKIKTLEADSESIGSVVDVIKGIAEQTNLLALNAAIEAARAGDQGRGFAVVADEVRTLAQRTQVSTQEIQEAIERLQGGTDNAVAAMSIGQERAQTASAKALKAGEALETISIAVTNITDLNALIASASQEQTTVGEQINQSLSNLHLVSNVSSEGAQKISQYSEGLDDLASELRVVVKQFNIG